jgi:hypothetical protein
LADGFDLHTRPLTLREHLVLNELGRIRAGRREPEDYWPLRLALLAGRLTDPRRIKDVYELEMADAEALDRELARALTSAVRLSQIARQFRRDLDPTEEPA